MKINNSKSLIIVAIVFISTLLFPSCVAKKKFVAMETSRNRAEQRVKELTSDIEGLELDFNEYKNDFHYNNSIKDSFIDSLNRTIVNLNNDIHSKSDNIEDQIFSFQVEKRRLNQLLADKDKEIRTIKRQMNSLEIQLDDLEKETQDAAIQNRNSSSEINVLKSQIAQKENEKVGLSSSLEKRKAELLKLKSSIASKDSEIEALKNQVNLLKSQIKQN